MFCRLGSLLALLGKPCPRIREVVTRQDPRFPRGRYRNGRLEQLVYRLGDDDDEADMNTLRPRCPQCRNQLVLRHGKYGDFWGCGDFPRCRFTVKPEIVEEAIRRHIAKVNTGVVQ